DAIPIVGGAGIDGRLQDLQRSPEKIKLLIGEIKVLAERQFSRSVDDLINAVAVIVILLEFTLCLAECIPYDLGAFGLLVVNEAVGVSERFCHLSPSPSRIIELRSADFAHSARYVRFWFWNRLGQLAPCHRQVAECISQVACPVVDLTGLECLLLVIPFAPVLLQSGNADFLSARVKHTPWQRLADGVDAVELRGHGHDLRV